MCNVTVSAALIRLKMCKEKKKFACAFVLNLKISVFCAEAVTVSCDGLLAVEDYVGIKGKYKVKICGVHSVWDLSVLKSFGSSAAVMI